MKKNILIILSMLLTLSLVTGCGCSKKENKKTTKNNNNNNTEQTVVEDQIFEGLEFVNVSAKDGVIKTVVINNTGYVYEGSKFSIKVMDENGTVITEEKDEVKGSMETGTTKEVQTKTKADLSKAASIEYSIITE